MERSFWKVFKGEKIEFPQAERTNCWASYDETWNYARKKGFFSKKEGKPKQSKQSLMSASVLKYELMC